MAGTMKYQISDETLGATTRCRRDFACLNGDDACLCRVEKDTDGGIPFVTCNVDNCPYRLTIEKTGVCACPTRIEILNRHGA